MELDAEPQEPNFPKVQFSSAEIAKQVVKIHEEWVDVMQRNDKIMMKGKTRPTADGS